MSHNEYCYQSFKSNQQGCSRHILQTTLMGILNSICMIASKAFISAAKLLPSHESVRALSSVKGLDLSKGFTACDKPARTQIALTVMPHSVFI